MAYRPAYAIALFVLMLLAAASAYGWLAFIKYPTNGNRNIAAGSSAALFGFVALAAALLLLRF